MLVYANKRVCCVPIWNMCHSETCLRLAWCAILKNMHFWNMFQIGTLQHSSNRRRMLNATSWSINMCVKRPKIRTRYIICLFFISNCKAASNAMSLKGILLSVPDMTQFARCPSNTCFRNTNFSEKHTIPIWNMFQAHHANMKHVSGCYMFQNDTQHGDALSNVEVIQCIMMYLVSVVILQLKSLKVKSYWDNNWSNECSHWLIIISRI